MPNDAEHFIKYVLAILTSSFENYLFNSLVHLSIEWDFYFGI